METYVSDSAAFCRVLLPLGAELAALPQVAEMLVFEATQEGTSRVVGEEGRALLRVSYWVEECMQKKCRPC